jgi:hypothetical protein
MEQWRSITRIQLPCGTYRVRLGLEVDPGSNHFALGYDNVGATITCGLVDVEDALWGRLKILYQ